MLHLKSIFLLLSFYDFLYFKNSLDQQGFIEQLSRTISELFQYQIGTQQLKSYQNNDNLSQKVKDKLFDLNMIMEDYQKFLKNPLPKRLWKEDF